MKPINQKDIELNQQHKLWSDTYDEVQECLKLGSVSMCQSGAVEQFDRLSLRGLKLNLITKKYTLTKNI